MKAKFEIGGEIDFVSPAELRSALSDAVAEFREQAQSNKWHEIALPLVNPATGLGPATYTVQGPAPGFAWKLRVVSSTLSATGTLAVYKGESANNRLIAANNTSAVLQTVFFPDDIVIQSDQQIFIVASTTLTNIYVGAVQVAAQRLGAHLG